MVNAGRVDDAISVFRRALALAPTDNQKLADTCCNLGVAFKRCGRLSRSIAAFAEALKRSADHAPALANMAESLKLQGRVSEALDYYHQAVAARPDIPAMQSNSLLALHSLPESTPESILQAHQNWQAQHVRAFGAIPRPSFESRSSAARPLKVGYLSPDFRQHSVARFFAPLLGAHNPDVVQSYCYADVARPDAVTAGLREAADNWRNVAGRSDDEVAQTIRRDELDILVDLCGHMAGNRLLVLARRPCPIQVTWLGYPGTTGMSAIDFRLTDLRADPPGAESECCEELVRLPNTFLCFQPPPEAPPVRPSPQIGDGERQITFGSFNNLSKLSPTLVADWAEILARVPGSRMILKAGAFAASEVGPGSARDYVEGLFGRFGIAASRLELRGFCGDLQDHLASYHDVDLALDTAPYNGTTTTCEALWMGVPVVSVTGSIHASRVGQSILHQVGFEELATGSRRAYRHVAVALASDFNRLERLRAGLRAKVASSTLCDARSFAVDMECVFKQLYSRALAWSPVIGQDNRNGG